MQVVWFDWSREDKVLAGRLTLELYGTQHTITNLSLISKAVRGWMKGVSLKGEGVMCHLHCRTFNQKEGSRNGLH